MTSPGWYPDPDPSAPQNRLRFWDGSAWTEQVRGADAGGATPPRLIKDTGGMPVTGPQAQGQQAPAAPQGYQQGGYGQPGYGDPAGQGAPGLAAPGQGARPGYGGQPEYAGQPGYGGQPGYAGQPGYGGQAPGYAAPNPTHLPDGTALANVWKRLGANLIDSLVMSAIGVGLAAVLVGIPLLVGSGLDAAGSNSGTGVAVGLLIGWLLYICAAIVVSVWYYILRVRKTGATYGKQWLGLQIRDWHRPGQLTWAQLLTRTLLSYVIGTVTGGIYSILDALWCLWDPHRQTLHDKLAGTVVVDHGLPRAPSGSTELAIAAASAPPAGWVAQGPEPVTPPGYPHAS